jgi:hypothetical protein
MKKRIETLEQYEARVSESFFSNMGVGEYQRIKNWLDEVGIKNYTINKDLTVDVRGNVYLDEMTFENLPVRFGKVRGYFSVKDCKNLKTLEGCPREVDDVFTCSDCSNLKSLEGCPKKVGGNFYCIHCSNLKSLDGCPEKVKGSFWCQYCGKQFTEAEVRKLCTVDNRVYV